MTPASSASTVTSTAPGPRDPVSCDRPSRPARAPRARQAGPFARTVTTISVDGRSAVGCAAIHRAASAAASGRRCGGAVHGSAAIRQTRALGSRPVLSASVRTINVTPERSDRCSKRRRDQVRVPIGYAGVLQHADAPPADAWCPAKDAAPERLPSGDSRLEVAPEPANIVVVDNGSTDDSRPSFAPAACHPSVAACRRLGPTTPASAAPTTTPCGAVDAEWVALLNNDTRVEPDWLSELMAAADRLVPASWRRACWTGTAHRSTSSADTTRFEGHSWQIDPWLAGRGPSRRSRDLLFACGGSMLVAREPFLDAGGFD